MNQKPLSSLPNASESSARSNAGSDQYFFNQFQASVSSFLIVVSVAGWISSMNFGWAVEILIGQLFDPQPNSVDSEGNALIMQSPFAVFLVTISLVQLLICFSRTELKRKWVLSCLLYVGVVGIFLVSTGIFHDRKYLEYLFASNLTDFGPWLPLKSRSQWTIVTNFFLGNLIGSIGLSVLLNQHVFSVIGKDGRERVAIPVSLNRTRYPVLCLVMICAGYTVAGLLELFGPVDFDLAFTFGLGLGLSCILFLVVYVLCSFSRSLFLLFSFGLIVVVVGGFFLYRLNYLPSSVTPWIHYRFSPAILSVSCCLTFYVLLMNLFNVKLGRTNEGHLQRKKESGVDPFSEEPVAIEENSSLVKTGEIESESDTRFSIVLKESFWGKVCTAFVALFFLCLPAHFIPQFIQPFVWVSFGDYSVARLVAQTKQINQGRHYIFSADTGTGFSSKPIALPLITLVPHANKNPFLSDYQINLELQPFTNDAERFEENYDRLLQIAVKYPNVKMVCHENGPNGKFYAKLATIVEHLPALNCEGMTSKEQKKLLTNLSSSKAMGGRGIPSFKNVVMLGSHFNNYKYNGLSYELFDCVISEDFDFRQFGENINELILYRPKNLTMNQIIDLTYCHAKVKIVGLDPENVLFREILFFDKINPIRRITFLEQTKEKPEAFFPPTYRLNVNDSPLAWIPKPRKVDLEKFQKETGEMSFQSKVWAVEKGQLTKFRAKKIELSRSIKSKTCQDIRFLSLHFDGISKKSPIRRAYEAPTVVFYLPILDRLPNLKILELDGESFQKLYYKFTAVGKVANIFLSPKLKQIRIRSVDSFRFLEMLRESSVETLILDFTPAFQWRRFL